MNDTKQPRRRFLSAAAAGMATGLAASPAASAASAADQPHKQVLQIASDNPVYGASSDAFEHYGYSPAVRAGGLLFIAGAVGIRPDGSIPASAAEQGELAMRRLVEILRLEGLTMADVAEVVSYHVDLQDNLAAFMPIKERYFERPFPAWTILGVAGLAVVELKIEIRATAALRT
jgi:enamine deaminase RidA (YjgF/YER057c/UK114 family)